MKLQAKNLLSWLLTHWLQPLRKIDPKPLYVPFFDWTLLERKFCISNEIICFTYYASVTILYEIAVITFTGLLD